MCCQIDGLDWRLLLSSLNHILSALIEATHGLLVSSETDAPLQLFVWPEPIPFSPQALLAAQGLPANTPVAVADITAFFAPHMRLRDGQTAEEQALAKRFAQILAFLQAQLTDLQTVRVGEIEITIWIVGKTAEGRLVGLTTLVVET